MNKDRAEGKAKDLAGRVERQVGEWTGDAETQARGAAKQVEGKVQNAWGKVKDAGKDAVDKAKKPESTDKPVVVEEKKEVRTERKVS